MPYKVVNRKGKADGCRILTSAYATTGSVEYKIGEPTRRRKGCGPLAAFNSLDDAISFTNVTHYPIFECDIKEYKGKKRALWEQLDEGIGRKRTRPEHKFPPGTILCDEITLRGVKPI